MKNIAIFLIVESILGWFLLLGLGLAYSVYWYDVRVGQYIELSDDASTASAKLHFLEKYVEQIKLNITRNDARYIFKRERLTRDRQLEILSTLMQRLKTASMMKPESFEYQQAMAQITGQEYNHILNDIDIIMQECWLRQSRLCVFELWFSWLPCLVILIVGAYIILRESF